MAEVGLLVHVSVRWSGLTEGERDADVIMGVLRDALDELYCGAVEAGTRVMGRPELSAASDYEGGVVSFAQSIGVLER